jgi:hypothetical protein
VDPARLDGAVAAEPLDEAAAALFGADGAPGEWLGAVVAVDCVDGSLAHDVSFCLWRVGWLVGWLVYSKWYLYIVCVDVRGSASEEGKGGVQLMMLI